MITIAKSSTANRGLKFEERVQKKCDELKEKRIALISKVPTEFKMIRGAGGKVVSAYPVSESRFVDFIGILNTYPIAIECKETKNTTSFPFSNIKESQIEFLELWEGLSGVGYYLLHFTELKEVWLIPSGLMHDWISNIGRKSVPHQTIVDEEFTILLDYDKLNFEDYI